MLVLMKRTFDSKAYGPKVAEILALDQDGYRLVPLSRVSLRLAQDDKPEACPTLKKQNVTDLFPHSYAPAAALGGLFLYFSCADDCHEIVQNIDSPEGSFWHAIVHRQEPDASNSAYWFRQTAAHPVFPDLAQAAEEILAKYPSANFRPSPNWDPFAFIDFCESARREPGSAAENAALEIQRAEWQLLFDYCARSRS
jgi:hypothetical protein